MVAIIAVAGIVIAIIGAIENSSPVVSLVGVIVQTLGFGGALIGLTFTYRQVQGAQTQLRDTHVQNRSTATWDAMVHYQGQWAKLKHVRNEAKKVLGDAKSPTSNSNLDQVINFFESLAYVTRVRSLNPQWVWFVFYSDAEMWLGNTTIADYIAAEHSQRPTVWRQVLPWLEDLRKMEKAAERKPIALGEPAERATPTEVGEGAELALVELTEAGEAVEPTEPVDIIV